MNNYKRAYANNALYQIAYMLCSGSIMQGFLLNSGIASSNVYFYESIVTTVSFLVLMASVFLADKVKKVIPIMKEIPLFIIPVFIVMTFASIWGIGNKIFLPLLCCAVVAYVFIGINQTVSYKLPYEIIDMKDYGEFTGVSGIISGASTFTISMLYSYAASRFAFFSVHGITSVFAIICLMLASYFVGTCKKIEREEEDGETKKFNSLIFKNPNMWVLLIPNFLRGVSAGIINLIAVVAVASKIISVESVSLAVIAAQLALFVGNFLFIKAIKKIRVQVVLLASGIIMFILLPFSVITTGTVSFFVIYFMVRLFMSMVDGAIPVCVINFVPYRQIGAFTSIRMMAMTCGTAVAPILLGFLEKKTSYFLIFTIAAGMKLVCSLAYACVTNLAQKAE